MTSANGIHYFTSVFPLDAFTKCEAGQPAAGSMREAADKAFLTAFLFSGSSERAEAAVLESIGQLDSEDASEEDLLQGTITAMVRPEEVPARRPKEMEPALATLRFELQRVVRLPFFLRQCFVLRVLVGLSREACARLLGSEIDQVDEGTCSAMHKLAGESWA